MDAIQLEGYIDDQHRLSADVPGSMRPGPVTVWIAPHSEQDEAEIEWADGVAREWADELSDVRQDIYTLADGVAVDPA